MEWFLLLEKCYDNNDFRDFTTTTKQINALYIYIYIQIKEIRKNSLGSTSVKQIKRIKQIKLANIINHDIKKKYNYNRNCGKSKYSIDKKNHLPHLINKNRYFP